MVRRILTFSLLTTMTIAVAGTATAYGAAKEDAQVPKMAVFTMGVL